jgi:HemY protein
MIRKIFATTFLIALIAGAVWLADNKGTVNLVWLGYEIQTSVAVLLGAASIVFVILALGLYFLLTLAHFPLHWRDRHRLKRQQQGIDYAGKALIALASQQGDLAESFAKKAHGLLSDHSLTLLLQAQATQLQQNTAATTRFYTDMTKRPETTALGMRGLITNARKTNDTSTTQKLITDFYYAHPENVWATENFVQEIVKEKNWTTAEQAITNALTRKILPRAVAQQALQGVLLEKSRLLSGSEALALLERAFNLDKKNVPTVIEFAHALLPTQEAPARTLLYKTWKKNPHPALATAFQASVTMLEPFAAYKHIKYFTAPHSQRANSLLMLAEAEFALGIVGKAKDLAERALKTAPSRDALTLLAKIATEEKQPEKIREKYALEAQQAAPLHDWTCHACGNHPATWHAVCESCDGFMTVS